MADIYFVPFGMVISFTSSPLMNKSAPFEVGPPPLQFIFIYFSTSVISTRFRELHSSKAPPPISLTDSGITIRFNERHPLNA